MFTVLEVDPPSKDGGGPLSSHEGWGHLLGTAEQMSSWDKTIALPSSMCHITCVSPVRLH